VILAGGTGSRLHPLTKVTNKHLLPICDKPMIYYPLQTLLDNKIKDIVIVTGREHMGDVMELLGSGEEFNADFTYKVQDKAGGIAQALGLCKNLLGNEQFAVILGDNIFLPSPKIGYGCGAQIFLSYVRDVNRFGAAILFNGYVVDIQEKPSGFYNGFAITGLYIYTSKVWDFIQKLKPSQRGELEISDVNKMYLNKDRLQHKVLEGFWSDAGTFESMKDAQDYIWRQKLQH
jgi:glucose-1-phosphate thymidylyltransferase